MGLKRLVAGYLAVFGGLMMLAGGYTSKGLLYVALGYAEPRISGFLTGAAANAAILAITALELLIAFGGLTVAIGGLLVLAAHTTTGRALIYMGRAGSLGLVVSFGHSAYKLGGLDPVFSYLRFWLGLALAAVGLRLAKAT